MNLKISGRDSRFLSYQCCVDGLDLVLLKRPEARHLAAQVGVNQHLRSGKKNKLIITGNIRWGGELS